MVFALLCVSPSSLSGLTFNFTADKDHDSKRKRKRNEDSSTNSFVSYIFVSLVEIVLTFTDADKGVQDCYQVPTVTFFGSVRSVPFVFVL